MTSLHVSVDDKEVLTVLRRISERFQPREMRPAMLMIGEKLLSSTKRRFAQGIDPEGNPWASLKEGTVLARYREMIGRWDNMQSDMAARRKVFYREDGTLNKRGQQKIDRFRIADDKPLIATGRLQKSLSYRVIDGGAGVAIGTNRNFGSVGAEVHQFGTRHIPARPFLGLSTDDKTTVLEVLNNMLTTI